MSDEPTKDAVSAVLDGSSVDFKDFVAAGNDQVLNAATGQVLDLAELPPVNQIPPEYGSPGSWEEIDGPANFKELTPHQLAVQKVAMLIASGMPEAEHEKFMIEMNARINKGVPEIQIYEELVKENNIEIK
jgi:hypothetical protein